MKPVSRTTLLLTGGASYIGSHTVGALLKAGYVPVVIDNFSNSCLALEYLKSLTGKTITCELGDALDAAFTESVLRRHGCVVTVHLGGHKAVGESIAQPLGCSQANIGSLVSLLHAMTAIKARAAVFSSGITVYGEPESVPIDGQFAHAQDSLYAQAKLMCEQILALQCSADPSRSINVLRYFNPVGAHVSGLVGEDPDGIPSNLMTFITQIWVGKKAKLSVFDDDYPTPGGTGVRDYDHVTDLAKEHVTAIGALLGQSECFTVNLGTGDGTSVIGEVRAFEPASGKEFPFKFALKRPGDLAHYLDDVLPPALLLDWRATRNIEDVCRDPWRWQQSNPNGYQTQFLLS